MKKFLLLLVVCLAFVSCTRDTDYLNFVASSEMQSNGTKTHLEPNIPEEKFEVIWDANDQIIVYGGENTNGIFTNENVYDDDKNQIAHFSGSTVTSGTYYSFYPVSIADDYNTFTLPTVQNYKLKSAGYVTDYPMYAQEDASSNHLYFRNLCGLAILYIHAEAGTQIRNVYLREPNDPYSIYNGIAGTFTVSCSGSTHYNEPSIQITNPEFEIRLDCTSNPQTLTGGALQYYIYVPQSVHRWLIVGMEFKRPGSSEWETTYTTMYASSFGSSYFNFERSKWNFISVDFTNIGQGEIYNVEDVTFNPNGADTVINTGVNITDSYDSYTFLVDVTPNDVSNPANTQRAIFSEMDYASPWNGPLIRIDGYSTTSYNNATNGNVPCYQFVVGTKRIKGPAAVYQQRQKFVCVMNASNNRIYIYWLDNGTLRGNYGNVSSSMWITASSPNSQVGGDQHKANRYFDGTVHQFSIYNRVFSTAEITEWLNS